jgi:hypothetical protein
MAEAIAEETTEGELVDAAETNVGTPLFMASFTALSSKPYLSNAF